MKICLKEKTLLGYFSLIFFPIQLPQPLFISGAELKNCKHHNERETMTIQQKGKNTDDAFYWTVSHCLQENCSTSHCTYGGNNLNGNVLSVVFVIRARIILEGFWPKMQLPDLEGFHFKMLMPNPWSIIFKTVIWKWKEIWCTRVCPLNGHQPWVSLRSSLCHGQYWQMIPLKWLLYLKAITRHNISISTNKDS